MGKLCSAVEPESCAACQALEKDCQKLHNKTCRSLGWNPKRECPTCVAPKPTKCEECENMSKHCLEIHASACKTLKWHKRKGCPVFCLEPNNCPDCLFMSSECKNQHK